VEYITTLKDIVKIAEVNRPMVSKSLRESSDINKKTKLKIVK